MVRVESVAYSIDDGGIPGTSPRQQSGEVGWTYTTALRRLSLIDRGKRSLAEIFAGQQGDAIRLEGVEGVFDLVETSLHVGRRDHGEEAEPPRMISHQPRAIVVELACQAARLLDIVSEPDPGLDDREDGGGNSALVHLLERGCRGPSRRRSRRAPSRRRHHGIDVKLRKEMMMHVDARLGGGSLRGGRRNAAKDEARGSGAEQEAPARGLRRGRQRIAAQASADEPASERIGGHCVPRVSPGP